MTRPRLDPCLRQDTCYPGASVYGPHHSPGCPRYRGNTEHNCGDCGTPIHYQPHAAWCPRAA